MSSSPASKSKASAAECSAFDVLLFIPNLIGYVRVLCTLSSLVLMILAPSYYVVAMTLYLLSFIGDLFDGMAARMFHQSSTYGGLLDMVTDRCSTLGLLYVLGGEYTAQDDELGMPVYRLTFLFLVLLDISSHWCQMHTTIATHAAGAHHKSADSNKDRNILVRCYYQYYYFFGYLCVGAECTYVCLYLKKYMPDEVWVTYLLYACLPGCVLKQIVNIMQLASACYAVAEFDAENRRKQE